MSADKGSYAPTPEQIELLVMRVHAHPVVWSHSLHKTRKLRNYQCPPALAVAASIQTGAGATIVATFSRQSGKDEMLAQIIAWLLSKHRYNGGEIVVALPAMSTQGAIARRRLLTALSTILTMDAHPTEGNRIELGRAACTFVSADAGAQSRGQTASLLLVANEAQDIATDLWDARFAPMAASTNATKLIMGTVWSAEGLLHREMTIAADLEKHDGAPRLFIVPWKVVALEVPAYGTYVRSEIARLGANHPFIQTEYELRPLDGAGLMFPSARQTLMRGTYPPLQQAQDGELYAATLDVAGESEDQVEGDVVMRANPRKDSTALSIHRLLPAPERAQTRWELVKRYEWVGTPHTALHEQLAGILRAWDVLHTVIDATGVGAGLASFLTKSLGARKVTRFTFSSASKSKLGWDYLGMVDAGRATVYNLDGQPTNAEEANLDHRFWQQTSQTTFTLLPGPGKLMRWSVPDPTVHDDLVISAALVAVLDELDLSPRTARGNRA